MAGNNSFKNSKQTITKNKNKIKIKTTSTVSVILLYVRIHEYPAELMDIYLQFPFAELHFIFRFFFNKFISLYGQQKHNNGIFHTSSYHYDLR